MRIWIQMHISWECYRFRQKCDQTILVYFGQCVAHSMCCTCVQFSSVPRNHLFKTEREQVRTRREYLYCTIFISNVFQHKMKLDELETPSVSVIPLKKEDIKSEANISLI